MKAMILAAGRGLRMRSLTDKIPKSLMPIANRPAIVHQLIKLANAGITDVVINVSYLAKQIIETLRDGRQFGVRIEYSFEPTALDTGGGIVQALPLLGSDPFLVLSADIWTDYPLEKLQQNLLHRAKAHLVLVDNPQFHPLGDFHLLPNQFLALHSSPKLTFASFAIYRPSFFAQCSAVAFPLSVLLQQHITTGTVTGEHYRGTWFNVGTMDELMQLERFLAQTNYNSAQ
jgi:N-acetyl-alpha-D-muramate 1-phosphate uridylyltransferase